MGRFILPEKIATKLGGNLCAPYGHAPTSAQLPSHLRTTAPALCMPTSRNRPITDWPYPHGFLPRSRIIYISIKCISHFKTKQDFLLTHPYCSPRCPRCCPVPSRGISFSLNKWTRERREREIELDYPLMLCTLFLLILFISFFHRSIWPSTSSSGS